MICQLRYYFSTSTLLKIYKTCIQPIYQYSVLIYGTANRTDLKTLESQQRLMWGNCFKNKKWESLKHIWDKHKLCLVREIIVYELFKLMVEIIRRLCGIKKLHEYISEQEITDTIKTGNRRKTSQPK